MGYDGTITIDTKIDTKSFEAQIVELEDNLDALLEEYDAIEKAKPFEGQQTELRKIAREVEKTKNRIVDLKEKQSLLSKVDFSGIGASFERLGKKVINFGLGLLGIRGLYGVLSRATHTYLSANQETANKLNSIWTALGNLVGPIVEKIANWVLKLVGYLNVFVKAISGGKIDLTKNMNQNTKSVKGTSGAMKELNKQMAQFDEATKLQDKVDTGFGGTSDLDSEAFKMPELNEQWVKKIQDFGNWVKDNWPTILKLLEGIGLVFATGKVASWLGNIGKIIGVGGSGIMGAGGSGLLGIATAVIALTALYIDLKNAIDKESETTKQEYENRAKEGQKSVEVGKKVAEVAKDATTTEKDHAEALRNIKSRLSGTNKSTKDYSKSIKDSDTLLNQLGYSLWGVNTDMEVNTGLIKDNTDKTNKMVDEVIKLANSENLTTEEKKDLLKVLYEEKDALQDARRNLDNNSEGYKYVQASIKNVNSAIDLLEGKTEKANTKMFTFGETSKSSLKKTFDGWKDSLDAVKNYEAFKINDKKAKLVFSADITQASSSLTTLANNVANSIQNAFNRLDLKSALLNQISKLPNTIVGDVKKALGLARGGIINLPGPGVPLTNGVVGGERGAEGVIPLTDSQQMEILGEAIGKYITINASITNTMNGRVISREIQKINGENDFASNR